MPKKFPEPQAFEKTERPQITLNPVESNQVKAVGYDPLTRELAVTFTRGNGAIYHYFEVAPQTFEDFIKAESIGKFFGQHIKHLPFRKYAADPVAA